MSEEKPDAGLANLLHRAVATRGIRLVCFDFGGTLFDFLPVHQNAFADVMGPLLAGGADIAANIVAEGIRRGDDSFAIAERLVRELHLNDSPVALTWRKREVVESLLVDARLTAERASLLTSLGDVCRWCRAAASRGGRESGPRARLTACEEQQLRSAGRRPADPVTKSG